MDKHFRKCHVICVWRNKIECLMKQKFGHDGYQEMGKSVFGTDIISVIIRFYWWTNCIFIPVRLFYHSFPIWINIQSSFICFCVVFFWSTKHESCLLMRWYVCKWLCYHHRKKTNNNNDIIRCNDISSFFVSQILWRNSFFFVYQCRVFFYSMRTRISHR